MRYLRLAVFGFLPLVILCTLTPVDLVWSGYFYDATQQRWFLADAPPWNWFFEYGELPGILLATGAAIGLLGSLRHRPWRRYQQQCLALLLAVCLGPGVLVNGILKPGWGRPRPRDIVQFDGAVPYRPWWRPGGPGTGRSFPSGHAAMGYVLLSGALLVSRRRVALYRTVVVGTLSYGTVLGVTRIVQGGHFPSDVVWSGLCMCVLVGGLQALLRLAPPAADACIRGP